MSRPKKWSQRKSRELAKLLPPPIRLTYANLAEHQPVKWVPNPEYSGLRSVWNRLRGRSDWDEDNAPDIAIPNGKPYPVLNVEIQRDGKRGSICSSFAQIDATLMWLAPCGDVQYAANELGPNILALTNLAEPTE